MRVLFYLGHPAQYHFIKYTAKNLVEDGHSVKILIKTKDILEDLLREDGWPYENIQQTSRRGSKWSILKASFERAYRVMKIARSFNADLLIGTDSSIAQAAWLLRKSAITTLEDDIDIINYLAQLTYPFTNSILVPLPCRVGRWERKKVPYFGYMKLAYLHPNRFIPDRSVIESYGIPNDFILIRLAGLTAHHDTGIQGLSFEVVKDVIEMAHEKGFSVYISSEKDLAPLLSPYLLRIKHSDIHHILAYASILISDSQSMSVEAAMLGTPSIRFSDFAGRISVLEEIEHQYGLSFGIKTSDVVSLKIKMKELLSLPSIREEFQSRRRKMLADKIDVTAFLTWFIENYPMSHDIVRSNPDYQLRFQ